MVEKPEFMQNPRSTRWNKSHLVKQVEKLQMYVHEQELAERDSAAVKSVLHPLRWYGVAYIGWGSWEEDVFFVEAIGPDDAIRLFEEEIEHHHWDGHGAHNERDRSIFDGQPETILVYEISEHAEYQAMKTTTWRKVK